MLFFGVFLHKLARTAAKRRTNVSTHSGKSYQYQTAGPIGTKFGTHVQIHLGMDIRQINCPSRHKGHLGGFRGSQIKNSGEAVKLAPTFVQVCGFDW